LIFKAIGSGPHDARAITTPPATAASHGKSIAGVRVRPWAAEGRPTWAQVWQRWVTCELILTVVSIYAWVDDLSSLWDSRKQALHDKWPDTIVVSTRPAPSAPFR
jgi:uncharacterized RDD family membrane protein YckC